jgi:hypothetical protein
MVLPFDPELNCFGATIAFVQSVPLHKFLINPAVAEAMVTQAESSARETVGGLFGSTRTSHSVPDMIIEKELYP